MESVLKFFSYLGWVLLLLVLPIWGVFVFLDALSRQGLNTDYTDLMGLSFQVRSLFEEEEGFGAVGESLEGYVVDEGNMRSDMIVRGELVSDFGGDIDIISHGEEFEIIYRDLTIEDCINMVARTGADTLGTGIEMIRIGEEVEALPLPITLLQAQEVCFDGVSVGWLFEK